MATAFPSALYARISPDGYSAEPEYLVTTQKASDGTELRIYNGAAWGCSFKLITRSASERTTLKDHYIDRLGPYRSFTFVSRDDLVERTVRFQEFSGRKTGPVTWEYAITLVSA